MESIQNKLKIDWEDPKYEGLSKKSIKKAVKKEYFELNKKLWRKQKREQLKERKKVNEKKISEPKQNKKVLRLNARTKSKDAPIVVIDASFESLLEQKSLVSFVNQLGQCNFTIKHSEKPFQLYITGVEEKTLSLLEARDYTKWVMNFSTQNYNELFSLDKFIYLTGDSDQIMQEYEEDKIYIIGGLVDHNKLKNITLDKAKAQGLKTMKLPIEKYVKLKTSSILTVNQCIIKRF